MGFSKAGFELGWRAFDQAERDKYQRERDAKNDARQAEIDRQNAEQFGWRREEYELAKQRRLDGRKAMAEDAPEFQGLELPSYLAPYQTGNPADMGAVPGMARSGAGLPMPPQQGVLPAPAAGTGLLGPAQNARAAQRKLIADQMAWARTQDRPDLYFAARENLTKFDNQARQGQLADWIMSAGDRDLDRLHEQVTIDPQNNFKMVRDPKTGYTTISEGQMAVKLTRPQLATYFSGLMAIRQGDAEGGLTKIASVSTALASKAKEQLDAYKGIAQVNNPANHYAQTDLVARMNAATNASRVGLENAQLKKFKELDQISRDYIEADEAYRNAVTQHGADSPATKAYKQRRDHLQMRASMLSGKPAEDPRRTVAGYADEIFRNALKEGTDPIAAAKARDAYLASNGVAPREALAALYSGKGPDGKPLTAQDVTNFNAEFPESPVDPAALPWLKPAAPAPVKGLPAPITTPASAPANPWMQRRQQVLDADRAARIARDEAERREQAARYEAERQAALAARPWLSQMGSKFQ